MDFFEEWIFTGIRERGWPKSKGLLKKTQVISERAIIESMQDAVRIGLVLGSGIPETARSIAIRYVPSSLLKQSPTQQTVNNWIGKASARGEDKIRKAQGKNPMWLQFCAIDTEDRDGNQRYMYITSTDQTHDANDPILADMFETAKAVAVIAMSWALEHPNECIQLFHVDDLETKENPDVLGARSVYDGWLVMAKGLASRYESVVEFQKFKDLPIGDEPGNPPLKSTGNQIKSPRRADTQTKPIGGPAPSAQSTTASPGVEPGAASCTLCGTPFASSGRHGGRYGLSEDLCRDCYERSGTSSR